jgi:hypothetical protein
MPLAPSRWFWLALVTCFGCGAGEDRYRSSASKSEAHNLGAVSAMLSLPPGTVRVTPAMEQYAAAGFSPTHCGRRSTALDDVRVAIRAPGWMAVLVRPPAPPGRIEHYRPSGGSMVAGAWEAWWAPDLSVLRFAGSPPAAAPTNGVLRAAALDRVKELDHRGAELLERVEAPLSMLAEGAPAGADDAYLVLIGSVAVAGGRHRIQRTWHVRKGRFVEAPSGFSVGDSVHPLFDAATQKQELEP